MREKKVTQHVDPGDDTNARQLVARAWRNYDRGNLDEALTLARRAHAADPSWAECAVALGWFLLEAGDADRAYHVLHEALTLDPGHAAAHWYLGTLLYRQGRLADADILLRAALRINPQLDEARMTLAWLLHDRGQIDQALEQCSIAVAHGARPHRLALLGWLLAGRGEDKAAAATLRRAVELAPDDVSIRSKLIIVLTRCAHYLEAREVLRKGLAIAPDNHDLLLHLGRVLVAQDRLEEAEAAFLKASDQEPQSADHRLALAEVRSLTGRFPEAVKAVSMAQALKPDWPDARRLLARCRFAQGFAASPQRLSDYWSEAAAALADLLREGYHDRETVSTLLRLAAAGNAAAGTAIRLIPRQQRRTHLREILEWAVHHAGSTECAELAGLAQAEFPDDLHIACAAAYIAANSGTLAHDELSRRVREWGRNLALTEGLLAPRPTPTQRPGQRLRVAYIASHLHSSLLLDVIGAHDRTRVEPFLYAPAEDMAAAKARLHGAAVVLPLSTDGFAESLYANGMDVVVDTAGLHPFHGQFEVLRALRRRLAPIQCGWLGTWGGGGGIYDALVADEQTLPPDMEPLYDEEIIRIPGGQWAWTPPLQAPEPGPLPCRARGYVTFASTVRGFRLSQQTLNTWAELLTAVPDARLELLGTHARDWRQRAEFSAVLQAHGVEPTRVGYRYRLPYAEHLEFFRGVDIYLDAFPGNGGLCSLDALWMGIPVVTLTTPDGALRWFCEGQGISVLDALGCVDWVGDTDRVYIRIASGLASDWNALGHLRSGLRQRLLASPLADTRRAAAALEAAWEGLHRQAEGIHAAQDSKSRARALARRALRNWLRRERSLILPCAEEPCVSIVIVLYNQAGLTLQALDALAGQRAVAFETIIVDNGSGDETHDLLQRIEGARILRNGENRGFLHAANQGAAMARGRHILFLNNDVILQQGALQAAVERLESAADIGVVGGRIVLADGRLQEAGCIAFGDGWTIGYGRGEDPNGPEYRFVRDIDFCSGAFLLVRGELWRTLGGFDPLYAPAYYEDTDLCLRVWAGGYRVVYEPAALMLHIEGGSADEGEPKALMRRNHTKFLQRHGRHLAQRPDSRTAELSIMRWAARPGPRILVVDDAVPHVVAGSGFVRARLLIQALDRHHVTLYPLWDTESDWRTTYASLPETVEVILGEGRDGFASFLGGRPGVYDVLLVSRPPNMAFIEGLRNAQPDLFHGLRILYDSEAVFAVRDIAKAALCGSPLPRAERRRRVREELEQARHADRVLAVSQRDADLFRQAGFPDVRIAAHAVTPRTTSPGVKGRSGMLFVGALNPDTPNEDGLIWFVHEVMPRIRERLPGGLVLSVAGECRSNAVAAMESPEVRILGRVDDLTSLYDAARLFVAPVRYAAGVPAKVIEAAGNGLPVVASAVLARQLGWTSGSHLMAARDSDEFAAAIVRLANDDVLWGRLRRSMFTRVDEQFDPESFAETVRGAMAFP